jgi:hypothetical protein
MYNLKNFKNLQTHADKLKTQVEPISQLSQRGGLSFLFAYSEQVTHSDGLFWHLLHLMSHFAISLHLRFISSYPTLH